MSLLELGSASLLAVAVLLAAMKLVAIEMPSAPRFGHRGEARRRAVERYGLFAAVELPLRWLAGVIATLPLDSLRVYQERELGRADQHLGLTPDEYSALATLTALVLGAIAAALARLSDAPLTLAVPAAAFGLILPTLHLQEVIRKRAKEITRGLPHAIEIASMCMSAGLDFVGALRLLSQPKNGDRDALSREFSLILEELELGHTRRVALLAFAARVPTEPVRDLVLAIVQAEQKGNPLAKAIQIQGRMLNMRRSVAAEEAAARAGVLMVLPMMLLLGCILLLLVGPFVAKGIGF